MSWNDSSYLLKEHSNPRTSEDMEEAENDLIRKVEKQERQAYFSRSTSLQKDGYSSSDSTPSSPLKPVSKKAGASVLHSIAKRIKRRKSKVQKIESIEEDVEDFSPEPLQGKALFKDVVMQVQRDIQEQRSTYGAIDEPRRNYARRKTFANLSAGFYPTQPTQTDHLFNRAEQVAKLFEETAGSTDGDDILEPHMQHLPALRDEESATTPFIEQLQEKKRRKKRGCCASICKCIRDQYLAVEEVLNPKFLFIATCKFIFFKVMLVMVPCIALAYFLYYYLDNPEIQFLPRSASISWWLIFFVRQLITMQIAIIIEHTFCDIIALRSTLSVKILGPLVTLALCNAEGWPLVLTCWGALDLVILHGNQPFIQNWFYFMDWDIDLLNNNPDDGILESDLYLRILISMVIVGGATIVKQTKLALYFGKRMFLHYRSRLEELLFHVTILSQLAQLADITEDEDLITSLNFEPSFLEDFSGPKRRETAAKNDVVELVPTRSLDMKENVKDASGERKALPRMEKASLSQRDSSIGTIETLREKHCMVEPWEEPVSKAGQENQPLIKDILHFRRAISYLKGPYPFTDSFGAADTREKFLHSTVHLYERLQRFLSDDTSEALSFEVISATAYNDDGLLDNQKERFLRKLFRPDKNDEVCLDAFVQSCDSVYKQLRFFLAGVENASQIDAVLERVANGVFFFLMALLVMSLLDFDPWSLLLSVSSLLVSFSFAVGPSISTYVGGVLLIAVRRPYDIGDRIVINSPTSDDCFQPAITWLVEDVNLSYTTLRFASTNEVATVGNGSLAQLRIHNGNRDTNALVTIPLFFRITTTHEEIELFYSVVKKYIAENSLLWNDIVFFRTESADTAMGYIQYKLRVEHSKTHQAVPQIMINKGVLIRFCVDEMLRRDIYHISSHMPVDIYLKENEAKNPTKKEQQGDKTKTKSVTMSDVLESSGLKEVR